MDEELIENVITVHGLRRIHVVRMGKAVDKGTWLERIPHYSQALVECQTQLEKDLSVHHLQAWWPAREPICVGGCANGFEGQRVLLWRLDASQGLRDAAGYATVAYLEYFGRWPNLILVQRLPTGATDEIIGYEDSSERVIIRLREAAWVPKGFLVAHLEEVQ